LGKKETNGPRKKKEKTRQKNCRSTKIRKGGKKKLSALKKGKKEKGLIPLGSAIRRCYICQESMSALGVGEREPAALLEREKGKKLKKRTHQSLRREKRKHSSGGEEKPKKSFFIRGEGSSKWGRKEGGVPILPSLGVGSRSGLEEKGEANGLPGKFLKSRLWRVVGWRGGILYKKKDTVTQYKKNLTANRENEAQTRSWGGGQPHLRGGVILKTN